LDMLKNLKVGTSTGNPVPLASVADISFGSAESRVERLNRMRMIEVQANLDNNATLGTALAAIAALTAYKNLPEGVREVEYGSAEYMAEMFSNFGLALLTGILMVAAVLVLLFKDFLQPFTILIA